MVNRARECAQVGARSHNGGNDASLLICRTRGGRRGLSVCREIIPATHPSLLRRRKDGNTGKGE